MSERPIHKSHYFGSLHWSDGLPTSRWCLSCGADSEGPPNGKATKPCKPNPDDPFVKQDILKEAQMEAAMMEAEWP